MRAHGQRLYDADTDCVKHAQRDDVVAKTANGDDRCVRMEFFHEHSPRVRELLASERFLRIGRLVEGDYAARTAGNCIEALVKPIGVVEGNTKHNAAETGSLMMSTCVNPARLPASAVA